VLAADPAVRKLYSAYSAAAHTYFALRHVVCHFPERDRRRPDLTLESIPRGSVWPDDIKFDDTPDYALLKAWLAYEEALRVNPDATYQPPPAGQQNRAD
jgi:hypothetical protein